MGYWKFLGATAGAVALVMLSFRITHNGFVELFAIGLCIGYFIRWTPPAASIGFGLWLALVVAVAFGLHALFSWASAHAAQPFGDARIVTAVTVWSIILALAIHPLCWWLGRRLGMRRYGLG
jgi:hypothetical protein